MSSTMGDTPMQTNFDFEQQPFRSDKINRLGTLPKRKALQKRRTLRLKKARASKMNISVWRKLLHNMRDNEVR